MMSRDIIILRALEKILFYDLAFEDEAYILRGDATSRND